MMVRYESMLWWYDEGLQRLHMITTISYHFQVDLEMKQPHPNVQPSTHPPSVPSNASSSWVPWRSARCQGSSSGALPKAPEKGCQVEWQYHLHTPKCHLSPGDFCHRKSNASACFNHNELGHASNIFNFFRFSLSETTQSDKAIPTLDKSNLATALALFTKFFSAKERHARLKCCITLPACQGAATVTVESRVSFVSCFPGEPQTTPHPGCLNTAPFYEQQFLLKTAKHNSKRRWNHWSYGDTSRKARAPKLPW